jgi:hypothetical protein
MLRKIQKMLIEGTLCAGCGKMHALIGESLCRECENKLAENKPNHPDPQETHSK